MAAAPSLPHRLDRTVLARGLRIVVVGTILGAVYVTTLLPGVGYHGDTAKFQFVGRILGTPHSTGYPAYTMLNYLFVRACPFGDLAYKANLLSALLAVAGVILLVELLVTLDVAPFLAAVAGLTFGLTPTLWSQAVVAEVYTLNLLFVAIVLLLMVLWYRLREERYLLAGCGVFALSLGNHLTMITFLPAILWLVLATDRRILLRRRTLLLVGAAVLVGASQYAYLFWRTGASGVGYLESRARTLADLWWIVRGGEFAERQFAFGPAELVVVRVPIFVRLLVEQYGAAIGLVLLGVAILRDRKLNVFFLLSAAGNVFYGLNYNIPDIFVYFIPTYFVAAVYLGTGLDRLGEASERWVAAGRGMASTFRRVPEEAGRSLLLMSPVALLLPTGASAPVFLLLVPPVSALVALGMARAPLVLLPVLLLVTNFGPIDQSDNTAGAKQAEAVLDTVGDDAVIVASPYDYEFYQYLLYYLKGEGRERGVNKNLYLVGDYCPEDVAAYLCDDRSFVTPRDGEGFENALDAVRVPTGLPVYRVDHWGVAQLEFCRTPDRHCAFVLPPNRYWTDLAGTETEGWYWSEAAGDERWRWSAGQGPIRIFTRRDARLVLRAEVASVRLPQRLNVRVDGEWRSSVVVTSGWGQPIAPITLDLAPGEHVVELVGEAPADLVPARSPDARPLAFALINLVVQPEDEGETCEPWS